MSAWNGSACPPLQCRKEQQESEMRIPFLATIGLAALVAACGKPAAVQPEPQIADAGPPAAAAPAETAPAAGPADFPTDQTTPEQQAELEKAAADVGLPVTKQTRTTFQCDNDETIEVRFFPDQGVAVLVRGGENIELNGEPVASGFKYSNGQTTIQGKGNELMLNVGMMATTKCVAA
jgi:membrane-bound inhibitor of C-type lysozyme